MWYGNGWGWWWFAFVLIFFFLPLGYGWGYRGWGPWYRGRHHPRPPSDQLPPSSNVPRGSDPMDEETGWGWVGIFLWFVLIVAIVWLIAAWGWGGHWRGRGY